MNLEDFIRNDLYKENMPIILAYVGTDRARFSKLMDLFFTEDIRLNQRSGLVISQIVDNHPFIIEPYINKLIKNLYNPVTDAIKRNTMRIFQTVEVPEPLWGETLEKCFEYLESNNEAIAIRVFSMTVAYNISQHIPEIKPELKVLLEDIITLESAGLKSRGKKIIAKLENEI